MSVHDAMTGRGTAKDGAALLPMEAFGEVRRQFLTLWLAQTRAATQLVGDVMATSVRTAGALWAPAADAMSRAQTVGSADRAAQEMLQDLTEEPAREVEQRALPALMADAATPGVAVTFRLPAEVAAHSAYVCGEFNGWSRSADPMDRLDDGSFELTRVLPVGQRWRFRYLLDGSRWENDWAADDYTPNEFGDHDSVVDLETPSASRLVRPERLVVEQVSA